MRQRRITISLHTSIVSSIIHHPSSIMLIPSSLAMRAMATTSHTFKTAASRGAPRRILLVSRHYHHDHDVLLSTSTGTTGTIAAVRTFASSSSSKDKDSSESSSTAGARTTTLSDEWIPPNRPLAGDQGGNTNSSVEDPSSSSSSSSPSPSPSPPSPQVQATARALEEALFVIDDDDSEEDIQRKLEQALRLEEDLEEQEFQQALQQEEVNTTTKQAEEQAAPSVDWLATRRKALGGEEEDGKQSPISSAAAIPILEHKLLTHDELAAFLEFQKCSDIHTVLDNPDAPRMGGSIGMMIASCQTSFHIQTVTKALIDHLKARKLQDLGVLGAQMGSNRFSPRNSSSNWNVVDCSTYLVHIMDTPTREALQLEDLWSGKDPIWKLDIRNEEAVDEYVSRHPVPRNYGYQQPATLWDIGKLERNQFVPHSPVVSGAQKQQDRRAGRRKRREMRQGY